MDDAVQYLAFGEKYWDILGYKDIYYIPVDDGKGQVLGCNVYITSQYFSPNAKY